MDALERAAVEARRNAHPPYSNFHVGAALEGEDGTIYTGVNVENSSYGLTMCAERTAAFHAMAQGARRFRRIVVATDVPRPAAPCGACRQVLWDLCGDIEVVLLSVQGPRQSFRLSELYPHPFDARSMS